jgi:hypothetical protein
MHNLVSDVRHALRTARQHPFVAFAAVLSVAICTGPNCALFSVAASVLLRPWPVEKPNELAYVGMYYHHRGGLSYPEYEYLARRSRSLAGVIAWDRGGALMNIHGQTEIHTLNHVSRNYFSVLGVKPRVGAGFSFDDEPTANSQDESALASCGSHSLRRRSNG